MEKDFKKVIALSTLSQLGFIVGIFSSIPVPLLIFYILIHAFFKATLFISVGATIHSFGGKQSFKYLSQRVKLLTSNRPVIVVPTISIAGLPFITGFYAKDLSFEFFLGGSSFLAPGGVLMRISALFTLLYSIRMLTLLFSHNKIVPGQSCIDLDSVTYRSSFFLVIMSIIGGQILSPWVFVAPLSLPLET